MPTTPDVVVGHLFPWFLSTKARHFLLALSLSLFFGSWLSLTEFFGQCGPVFGGTLYLHRLVGGRASCLFAGYGMMNLPSYAA